MGAQVAWRLFNSLGASQERTALVEFVSGGRKFRAAVPSNQLWVSIKDVLVYEDYEILDEFRLSRLPTDAVVLDAGAFVGLYSLKASPYARRVVALEPGKSNLGYLESNLIMNSTQNIEVRKAALAARSGYSAFLEAGTDSSLRKQGGQLVATTTLDDLVRGIGRVDLMKMDIEGSEYEVFEASHSALKAIDRLTAEVHVHHEEHRMRLKRLIANLHANDFKVQLFTSPFQSAAYGMTKPWLCGLRRYNRGNAALYRLLLSMIYGASPLARALKRSMEVGSEGLLFACKK